MNRGLILVFVFGCFSLVSCSTGPREGKGGWHFDVFGLGLNVGWGGGEHVDRRVRGLELGVEIEPQDVRVGETRRLSVAVSLTNGSRGIVNLAFPTTQRLEMVWRDESGGVVARWSEDQSFRPESMHLTMNPRERVEYHESIATRDLKAGRLYRLEVTISAYPDLTRSVEVRPRG